MLVTLAALIFVMHKHARNLPESICTPVPVLAASTPRTHSSMLFIFCSGLRFPACLALASTTPAELPNANLVGAGWVWACWTRLWQLLWHLLSGAGWWNCSAPPIGVGTYRWLPKLLTVPSVYPKRREFSLSIGFTLVNHWHQLLICSCIIQFQWRIIENF